MELEHRFTVPVPVAQAWDVLLDVERIAPCMPGATVDSFDGETIVGKVKVKVGPIQVTYAGTARFSEQDEAARRAVIEANAKEARGSGTANATITAQLQDDVDADQRRDHEQGQQPQRGLEGHREAPPLPARRRSATNLTTSISQSRSVRSRR